MFVIPSGARFVPAVPSFDILCRSWRVMHLLVCCAADLLDAVQRILRYTPIAPVFAVNNLWRLSGPGIAPTNKSHLVNRRLCSAKDVLLPYGHRMFRFTAAFASRSMETSR